MANTINKFKCLNSTHLKIIAMVTMFMDHAAKTIFINQEWLMYVGRLAFPIFAFQIAEGYNHTKDFKAYLKRMFKYALIAEIPYNVMAGGPINPSGQNVLFTFCIALIVIRVIDLGWQRHWAIGVGAAVVATYVGYILAFILMTDYMGFGVLMVVVFWLCGRIKYGWIFEIAAIIYINVEMIRGLSFVWTINGNEVWIPMQTFAVFALIPIFMYNGKKGQGGAKFQRAVYIFYPAHMLILGLLKILIVY